MADDNWRLIVDENSYADFSVSVSPAIEKAVVKGEAPPTVYLNIFDVDSITIGMNEDPDRRWILSFVAKMGFRFVAVRMVVAQFMPVRVRPSWSFFCQPATRKCRIRQPKLSLRY